MASSKNSSKLQQQKLIAKAAVQVNFAVCSLTFPRTAVIYGNAEGKARSEAGFGGQLNLWDMGPAWVSPILNYFRMHSSCD